METAAPNPYGQTALAMAMMTLENNVRNGVSRDLENLRTGVRADMTAMEVRLNDSANRSWVRHNRDHEAFDHGCESRMAPLLRRFSLEEHGDIVREARIGPIRSGIKWLLDNSGKVVALVGVTSMVVLLILAALQAIGDGLPWT